jgi:membrane protein implicated in regulation of membrane protease activity
MLFKPQSKTVFGYTIYAIIGTILELTVLLTVLLWVLPLFNIYITWWILAILLAIELGISIFTYIMGRRALSKKLMYGPDAIIGSEGVVATAFNPTGYVKIRGELWKASCQSSLKVGDEVVVTEMEGLKLMVVPKTSGSSWLPSE